MQVGVMVGPERGDTSRKVARMLDDIAWADAGVTDLSVRLLPIGTGRDELIASKHRTREVLAGIAADLA